MSTSRTREKADGELFKSTGIDDNATSTKVTVSNTGVDVTGRATTDGITSSGSIIFDNGGSSVGIHSDGSDGSYIAYGANEWLRFLYDAGGGETMRMHDSGYVTMPQGVTLGNGNTYAAANTLDDYEEGFFNVACAGQTTQNNLGRYVKVGQMCTVTYIFVADINAAGGSPLWLGGFPFVTGSGCGTLVNLFLQNGDAEAGSGTGTFNYGMHLAGDLNSGGSSFYVRGNSLASNPYYKENLLRAGSVLRVSCTYRTS